MRSQPDAVGGTDACHSHVAPFLFFLDRDNALHAATLSLLNDDIAIVPFVSDQMLSGQSLDQFTSKATVCPGSFCSKDSD